MRQIEFYKYHGAGNDFVMIDNRKQQINSSEQDLINFLCKRHFGIGADGLILLENHDTYDFMMHYFNADGRIGSMCGNGGRCAVAFAYDLGIVEKHTEFLATDGAHKAEIFSNGEINLKMIDVSNLQEHEHYFFADTGSPHYVEFNELKDLDVLNRGKDIRFSKQFSPAGCNVNFVEVLSDHKIALRTYERGVEDETLACGTGATAAALVTYKSGKSKQQKIEVEALGGLLEVSFKEEGNNFTNIWLKGPAKQIFKGLIKIDE